MPIPSKPAEFRRLYQQIADQIRALIQSGRFPPGSRLPAERELAQSLGISRPSLREALIALEIEGSVEICMGSGVFVCAPVGPVFVPTRSLGESPSELMQARAAIEGTVVVLACARMNAKVLTKLRRTLDAMSRAIAQERKPLEQDRLFHLTIAMQSGNSVLTRIIVDLFDERHSPISAQLTGKFETPETWAAALVEHEAIYAALEAEDPLSAQSAMSSHLQASRERWSSRS